MKTQNKFKDYYVHFRSIGTGMKTQDKFKEDL